MTNVDEEEEEKVVKPLFLQLVTDTGGKLPPGDNWLSSLPVGTGFFCRDRKKETDIPNWIAFPFEVLSKLKKVTKLLTPDGNTLWVITKDFSLIKELIEVVEEDK